MSPFFRHLVSRPAAALAGAWLAAILLAGCGDSGANFSQYPGFAAYFAAHPPSGAPPSLSDQALLARYRPRLFLPAGHEGPIHFYEDYIAHGRLIGTDGSVVPTGVSRALLNRVKDEPRVVFEHVRSDKKPRAVMFARVDRERVPIPGTPGRAARFTFLTYHAVFRRSGLPAGVPGWQTALLGLVADPDDWHQLDHYTALTVALNEAGRPVAATFQQHNYMRTYVLGLDLAPPPDGRIKVDVAIRSNELYPNRPGRRVRRAVGFLNGETASYLLTGRDKPFRAADDITDSIRETDYALEFLAPADAFYTFKGFLGERRWLPGRSGPPGADYNTLPALKPKAAQMLAFHWREDDTLYLAHPPDRSAPANGPVARRFFRELSCAHQPIVIACR